MAARTEPRSHAASRAIIIIIKSSSSRLCIMAWFMFFIVAALGNTVWKTDDVRACCALPPAAASAHIVSRQSLYDASNSLEGAKTNSFLLADGKQRAASPSATIQAKEHCKGEEGLDRCHVLRRR